MPDQIINLYLCRYVSFWTVTMCILSILSISFIKLTFYARHNSLSVSFWTVIMCMIVGNQFILVQCLTSDFKICIKFYQKSVYQSLSNYTIQLVRVKIHDTCINVEGEISNQTHAALCGGADHTCAGALHIPRAML